MSVVLKDLLLDSKDGEWGSGEPGESSVPMLAIRGTDFERVRVGSLSDVPLRHIPARIAVRKALRPLDIVFETAGGSKDRPTGRSILLKSSHFEKTSGEITCASFARFLRIDPVKANPEYVFWLLQHLYNSDVLRKYHTQHTGVARYQYTTFAENEPLTLPDLATQRRIASILSAYDDLIENNTRRIAILEEMARRLYEEWFVRFRFPGHEGVRMVESEVGVVPEGWKVAPFQDIATFTMGLSPKGDTYNEDGVGTPLVNGPVEFGDRFTRRIKWTTAPSKFCEAGDLVVCVRGSTTGKYVKSDGVYCLGRGVCAIRSQYQGFTDQLFFHELPTLLGQTGGSTFPSWTGPQLKTHTILVPPETLLAQFEGQASVMSALVFALSRKNTNLRTTRDLLLPKLISGELDVSALPEPETIST